MAIKFELRRHDMNKTPSVDILKDGQLCATIYPNGDGGIKIVSAHFAGDLAVGTEFPAGVTMDNGSDPRIPIPAVLIRFDPQAYTIDDGKLHRGETIHALRRGFALCGFSPLRPADWPDGHIWAHSTRPDRINCPGCKEKM